MAAYRSDLALQPIRVQEAIVDLIGTLSAFTDYDSVRLNISNLRGDEPLTASLDVEVAEVIK